MDSGSIDSTLVSTIGSNIQRLSQYGSFSLHFQIFFCSRVPPQPFKCLVIRKFRPRRGQPAKLNRLFNFFVSYSEGEWGIEWCCSLFSFDLKLNEASVVVLELTGPVHSWFKCSFWEYKTSKHIWWLLLLIYFRFQWIGEMFFPPGLWD